MGLQDCRVLSPPPVLLTESHLGGSEQDEVQRLNHAGCKLKVHLIFQAGSQRLEHFLAAQEAR